jgi:chloramphenicol-sensitive protein RarD
VTLLWGVGGAALANFLWGMSPLYYGQLGAISPVLLLCAQVVLTFLVLTAIQGISATDLKVRNLARALPTAALIGLNWAAYVAAILHEKPLQASVAYLIAPVLTLLLASIVFDEPMSRKQKVGSLASVCAVVLDVVMTGEIPYYGVLIALPFAAYIVLHKKSGEGTPLKSLQREALLLAPAAIIVAATCVPHGEFVQMASGTLCALGFIGIVTAFPLALFVRSAPRLSPVQLSACQFIAPITSAIVSYFAFNSPIGMSKLLVLSLLSMGMAFAVLPAKPGTPTQR